MLKPTSEIKPGDKIILRDGKTSVTVTAVNNLEGDAVKISWVYEKLNFMIYEGDEQLEVISDE